MLPGGMFDQDDWNRATMLPRARLRMANALRTRFGDLGQAIALWMDMPRGPGSSQAGLPAPDARDALARMAVSSSDAGVYALAFHACGEGAAGPGACQMLSAEQWARLDPGNAAPWISILADVPSRKDRSAVDQALYRISVSRQSDSRFSAIPGAIVGTADSDDESMLAAWTVSVEAIGTMSAWTLRGYRPLIAECRGASLADANRRQVCAAIAELLVERPDSMLERSIGTSIGEAVCWPVDRIDRLRGELSAYAEAVVSTVQPGELSSCSALRRQVALIQQRSARGEGEDMRHWVANSGKSPQDFIDIERARKSSPVVVREGATTGSPDKH